MPTYQPDEHAGSMVGPSSYSPNEKAFQYKNPDVVFANKEDNEFIRYSYISKLKERGSPAPGQYIDQSNNVKPKAISMKFNNMSVQTASSTKLDSPAPGTYTPYEDAIMYRSPSALLT